MEPIELSASLVVVGNVPLLLSAPSNLLLGDGDLRILPGRECE